jgi:phosphoglycerate dehydrogenase-like enzyme
MMNVLIASPRHARLSATLAEQLPNGVQLVLPTTWTTDELVELAGDADVIVCVRLDEAVARAARKLKLVQKTGAGVDAIPFDALGEGVVVANTSGSNAVRVAEGAVALVLALAKHVVRRHARFPHVDDADRRGVELRGKTAGILGLGHIGVEVARRLAAFDMRLLALKRHPTEPVPVPLDLAFLGGPEDLDHLLHASDFVIVTVPLTPETRGLIGDRELRAMRPTAFLVNVARAAIIHEAALYRALTEGWIAGAGLDVWWPPHWWDARWHPAGMTPKYPIWTLPNVIATPHNVGATDAPSDAALRIIAENIRRLADGRSPINQVDRHLQY